MHINMAGEYTISQKMASNEYVWHVERICQKHEPLTADNVSRLQHKQIAHDTANAAISKISDCIVFLMPKCRRPTLQSKAIVAIAAMPNGKSKRMPNFCRTMTGKSNPHKNVSR